ncbi:MAG: ankyrin repeat protein [Candidatus Paraimprobicoccus trichonymphae]|uniref:Ankyrin repeat protein n=1 Tax=Candidatus Paraimprobicoccus trichonymphae TaxID=3033793 RepID=A0AA48KWI1_9FIRM|nr:MAG: ankyrin repeat protein [Candidatus Paraimprobicoccus trichonymphae]
MENENFMIFHREETKEKLNLDIIKVLIDYGADVNWRGTGSLTDYTALESACKLGNKDLIKFLVEKGADINGENGYRAVFRLFLSINYMVFDNTYSPKEVLKFLIESGLKSGENMTTR